MTTETKTPTADELFAAEVDAETEVVVAEFKQAEEDDRRLRARFTALSRVGARRNAEAAEQPGYWPPRLARHGMAVVTDAPGWEQCPVPKESASTVNFDGRRTDHPRPVAYCATVWTLDGQGIHLRAGDYLICSPVFQTERGVNGGADRFAVLVDGTWRAVDGPPIPAHGDPSPNTAGLLSTQTVQRLTAAGLVLNSEALQVVYDRVPLLSLDYQPAQVAALHSHGHVTGSSAGAQLAQFLDAHKTEVPTREGNRR